MPFSTALYLISSDSAMLVDSMVNLHDHLLAAEKRVANELACSQGDWLLAVRHVCDWRIDVSVSLPSI
jgi:hypothetical protein